MSGEGNTAGQTDGRTRYIMVVSVEFEPPFVFRCGKIAQVVDI